MSVVLTSVIVVALFNLQKYINFDQFMNKPVDRLQAQSLPDAASPIGKIYPCNKMAITFEPILQFGCSSEFRKFFITMT